MSPTANNEEIFILKKMIEGDKKAFKYFFDTFYSDLCNFVNTYINDNDLSEEIVQDIFVYFWENKSKLQLTHSVKSYLFCASKYKSLNCLRDRNRHLRVHAKMAEQNIDTINLEEEVLDTQQLRNILQSAINNLPPRCKEIFLLSKTQELSNKEIAEQLNISVKGVENQITIALKKLRVSLLPYREKIFILFLILIYS